MSIRYKRYVMDAYELAAMPAFDFDAAYRADGWSDGIAWRAYAWQTEPDEDTEWSGYEVPTGRILAHMIGDDRPFEFDPDELTALEPGAYCVECGQVGCRWHTEEV
jgi:hypothetical protein